jgi:hypothetical protein
VIIEGAPADTSATRLIRHRGIENVCMAKSVSDKAYLPIEALCGEHVACMLGDEVRRSLIVLRSTFAGSVKTKCLSPSWVKSVEGINILEKFAVRNIPDTRVWR